MEYPKLKNWNNQKLINRISKYWVDRVKIQNNINVETIKAKDLEEREVMNPNNTFDIGDKNEKNKILDYLQELSPYRQLF